MKLPWCEICKKEGHYATFCFQRRKKPIKKEGKVAKQWRLTRTKWARADAGSHTLAEDKVWNCHYCGAKLVKNKHHPLYISGEASILTLDHIIPRSSRPSLRNELSNIVPCCFPDNILKGSQSYTRFCERWYPHLLGSS